jgi:hypothetical protein
MRCEYCGKEVGATPICMDRPASERAMFLFRDDLLATYSLDVRLFCDERCRSAWDEADGDDPE